MGRQDRDRRFIHQFLRIAGLEYAVEEGMIAWNRDQDVNIFIVHEGLRCLVQIVSADKIKLGIKLPEHFPESVTLCKEVLRKRYIMIAVHINNMQGRVEDFQYIPDWHMRNAGVHVLEIGQ